MLILRLSIAVIKSSQIGILRYPIAYLFSRPTPLVDYLDLACTTLILCSEDPADPAVFIVTSFNIRFENKKIVFNSLS